MAGIGGLELWGVDLEAAGSALRETERRTPRLSSEDRAYAAAFSDSTVAAERLAVRIALRILIERAAGAAWRGAPLQRGAHGKPYLPGARVAFSVSHAPGVALVGISADEAVGVDVERARHVRVRSPRREAIETAAAVLNAAQALPAEPEARFLQAWVRLEAYAKAQGGGVGRLLGRLGIVGGGAHGEIEGRLENAPAGPRTAVHDVALREGLFAAFAVAPAADAPEPQWMPHGADAMEALLVRREP